VSFVAAVLTLSVTVSASSLTVFAMVCLLQKLSWGLPHDQSRLLWLKVYPRLDHLRRKDCHPKVSYLVGWRVGPKLGASPPVVTLPPACELCVLATGAILIGFIECSSCLVPDKSPAQGGREFATVIRLGPVHRIRYGCSGGLGPGRPFTDAISYLLLISSYSQSRHRAFIGTPWLALRTCS
jgi:hypothetical protein